MLIAWLLTCLTDCSSVSESLSVTDSHKEPLLEVLAGLKKGQVSSHIDTSQQQLFNSNCFRPILRSGTGMTPRCRNARLGTVDGTCISYVRDARKLNTAREESRW